MRRVLAYILMTMPPASSGLLSGGDGMKRWIGSLLLLFLLAGCGGQPQVWRGYGGDGSRSLCARERGPNKPRLLWVTDLNGTNPGCPVIDEEGRIYIPHSGGSITQVDSKGKIQWRFDSWVSGSSSLPPHLVLQPGGKILMSTQGSREETFRISSSGESLVGTGWLPWPASVSPAVTSSGYTVVCHQYVNAANTVALRIYGIVKGGEPLWRRDFAAQDQSFYASYPVVLEDGRAFVFVETDGGDNFLLALGAGGELLWQTDFVRDETRGVGMAIAAGQDGTVFFGTPRIEDINRIYSPGWLYAVAQGKVLWRVQAGQRIEQIFLAPNLVVANVLRSKLLALDMEGKELWQFELAGWESNGVMDSRGRVYMAGVQQGTIWIKAVARGKEVWEFDTGQPATSASFMALVDGTIYLVSDDGKLMAISD